MEGDFSHFQGDINNLVTSTGDIDVSSGIKSDNFILNAIVDFDMDPIALSLGLGVGSSSISFEKMVNSGFIAVAETNHSVSAYQAIVRASYKFKENFSIGIHYSYLRTSHMNGTGFVDSESGGQSDIEYDGVGVSLIELAFTFRF